MNAIFEFAVAAPPGSFVPGSGLEQGPNPVYPSK
jgi:hypothetical protein